MRRSDDPRLFETTLDTLLAYLGATTLIMTGVAGNICILFSANDAYMRDYEIIVPSDCVSPTPRTRTTTRSTRSGEC
jgi:nicotinamidase-related amidase